MKITVINGNIHHGSTWHSKELLLAELKKNTDTQITEFYLPKDMPDFCVGCYSCFLNGEYTCPHAERVSPIVEALTEADVVALASPVYAMDVSGQMKTLLDHLCFMWMSHRPNPKMFNKIGVVIATTAGAGLSHTAKTLKNSLKFWGVKRMYDGSHRVAASKWDEVSEKNKAKIAADMSDLAKKITNDAARIEKMPSPLFRSVMFKAMIGMMKKNEWNPRDRDHWKDHGWLDGKKAF